MCYLYNYYILYIVIIIELYERLRAKIKRLNYKYTTTQQEGRNHERKYLVKNATAVSERKKEEEEEITFLFYL